MKTLYFNGTILTMEEPLYADAVLVEDGKILQIGEKEKMEQKDSTMEFVDLKGAVMLPGFIDAHSHFTQVAFSFLQVSLDGVKDVEVMREKMNQFKEKTSIKDGEWLVARDYDHNILPEGKHLSLAILDSLSPDHPMVIHHKSGHMGLFNSLALKELKITEDTVAPEGGKIEKDENGLTGYVEENAFFYYLKQIPMASMDKLLEAYKMAQDKYASYGITTLQEGMVAKQMLPLYHLLMKENFLKLDLVAYADMETYEKMKEEFPANQNQYDQHMRVGGIKMFLDGSPQGRTAWMRTPYQGEDSYCGYGTMSDEEVCKVFEYAGKEQVQVIAHCNGDAASEQFLRCLQKVAKTYPNLLQQRLVIIHGQLMGIDQLPLAKKLGVIVSFFIGHTYYWGDVHIKNFGFERASQISPAASAKKCEVLFTFHQDAPVINPDMLETVWCATNRYTREGVKLGEEECLPVLEALKAITINSAYQYFEEDTKGSIAVGKDADFVILNKNPLTVPKEEIKNIKIIKTIKKGEIIMEK